MAAFATLLLAGGCAKNKTSEVSAPAVESRTCFEATASANGASTRAVFSARHCQGGGVTWAPLLQALAKRRGPVTRIDERTPGWTGVVYALSGTRFSIDDEGDAAQFCSNDAALVSAVRADYQRLNADAGALRRALSEASAVEMECLEADGSVPAQPVFVPPPEPGPAILAQTRADLERVRKAIHDQPVWCFPPDDGEGLTGALRFSDDGLVTWTAYAGAKPITGKWNAPPPTTGDPRIEVIAGAVLHHFDVGASGRLGFNLIGKTSITREELVPGDACLRGK